MLKASFERKIWHPASTWKGLIASDTDAFKGKKAMKLTTVEGNAKCGTWIKEYFIGKFEFSIYAKGKGKIRLGVIRYDLDAIGKSELRWLWQNNFTELADDYVPITYSFELTAPVTSQIALVVDLHGEGVTAWVDEAKLVRTYQPPSDFSKLAATDPSYDAAARKIHSAKQISILYLGDSLTDFYRGGNHVDIASYFLNRNHCNIEFTNYACRGDFISRVMARFNGEDTSRFSKYYEHVFDKKYDLAFIFLGHNDTVTRSTDKYVSSRVSLDEVRQQYRKLFDLLKSKGTEKIVLISPASCNYEVCAARAAEKEAAGQEGVRFGNPEKLEAFASVIKELAQQNKFLYLDVYTPMKTYPRKAELFNPDGVHLSPQGHEFIALKTLEFMAANNKYLTE